MPETIERFLYRYKWPNRARTRQVLQTFFSRRPIQSDIGQENTKNRLGSVRIGGRDSATVCGDIRQAAQVFHREGSRDAEQFVADQLRLLLKGKVGHVVGRLKRLCDQHELRSSQRRTVSAIIGYYENNRQHMRYGEYMAAGYPIGSGVAEGACRHVVKDRREQTGMRWTVAGALGDADCVALLLLGGVSQQRRYVGASVSFSQLPRSLAAYVLRVELSSFLDQKLDEARVAHLYGRMQRRVAGHLAGLLPSRCLAVWVRFFEPADWRIPRREAAVRR